MAVSPRDDLTVGARDLAAAALEEARVGEPRGALAVGAVTPAAYPSGMSARRPSPAG